MTEEYNADTVKVLTITSKVKIRKLENYKC